MFLFDEPLSNLDAVLQVQMRAEIRGFRERLGSSSIFVMHDLLTCLMAAFILAVVRFPGRNLMFVLLMVTPVVPGQVKVIPRFIICKWLYLYGTQAPLYAPAFLGGAFGTFLMRQYLMTIPVERADAARIDGASLARTFFAIYLPL